MGSRDREGGLHEVAPALVFSDFSQNVLKSERDHN